MPDLPDRHEPAAPAPPPSPPPAPASASTAPRSPRGGWKDVAVGALIASVFVVSLRTAFFALKDGHLGAGLEHHALRCAARHLTNDGALTLAVALALASIARFPGHLPRLALGALAAGLAYAFVSFRLPARPYYAPALDGPRALAAHGVALATALAAAGLLLAPPAWRPLRRALVAAAVTLLVSATAARLALAGRAPTQRPNLILISLDTLRRDHLGCYGYGLGTSPELDRFAERALRFDRAFTPQPWTLTAHMSMLTGLYPSVHDVAKDRGLGEGAETLAERLHAAGYTTLAVVDRVIFLDPRFGFDRGFDLYHQLPDAAATKRDHILELIDDAGDAPLFLFLHFYDAHSDRAHLPYESRPEDLDALAGEFDPSRRWCDGQGQCASAYLRGLLDRKEVLEGEARDHLEALYDAGIKSLDREIGALLDGLERRGMLETSVVLITSDHGEEFFEHGRPLHSQCYDECVAIPFLLYAPGGATGQSAELASLVDVMPTFLELAGLPPGDSQGVSLAPLLSGELLPRAREDRPARGPERSARLARRHVVPRASPPREPPVRPDRGPEPGLGPAAPGRERPRAGTGLPWDPRARKGRDLRDARAHRPRHEPGTARRERSRGAARPGLRRRVTLSGTGRSARTRNRHRATRSSLRPQRKHPRCSPAPRAGEPLRR